MMYLILASLIAGVFSGYFILPENIILNLDKISSFALNLTLLSVGIDLGHNKEVFWKIKKTGVKILLVPLSVIIGSYIGGIIASIIYKVPGNLGLSISSGFGWYSLSGIILKEISSAEAGTIAFLTNVFKELFAVILIPIIASKLNFFTAISPAGATAMDTTLPLIAEATNEETVVVSFITGAILSSLVPVLVPLTYSIKF